MAAIRIVPHSADFAARQAPSLQVVAERRQLNPISRKFIIMPTRDAPPRSYQRSRERQKSAIAALVLVFALLGGCVLSLLP
jgi:hypothetical protein